MTGDRKKNVNNLVNVSLFYKHSTNTTIKHKSQEVLQYVSEL